MTTLTNANNINTAATNATTNNSSTIPASTFAGAIKSLTQKYKTMHLSNSIDQSISGSSSNNNNSNMNMSYKAGTTHIQPTTPATTINTSNMLTELGSNNVSNNSDNASTNNSDSTSSSDDNNANINKVVTTTTTTTGAGVLQANPGSVTAAVQLTTTTTTSTTQSGNQQANKLSNRNSIATPTGLTAKFSNANSLVNSLNANVEWTQVIKLNNGGANKIKSDLNNNSNDFNNNTTTQSSLKEQFNDQSSLMQLTQSSLNGANAQSIGSTLAGQTHIPTISYQANNASVASPAISGSTSNHSGTVVPPQSANRINKSPVMKKLSSPINLPAINDPGRSTPQ
jgi:hypothetical protein